MPCGVLGERALNGAVVLSGAPMAPKVHEFIQVSIYLLMITRRVLIQLNKADTFL